MYKENLEYSTIGRFLYDLRTTHPCNAHVLRQCTYLKLAVASEWDTKGVDPRCRGTDSVYAANAEIFQQHF